MIIVRIFGGLGNQMFQYAFGKYLEQYGNQVVYDLYDFSIHNHHQGYELEKVFNIVVDEASFIMVKKLVGEKNSWLRRVIRKVSGMDFISKNEIVEYNTISTVQPVKIMCDRYFDGYWQNIVYVDSIMDKLKTQFVFNTKLKEEEKKMLKKYADYETVSIHVRRGDYVNNKELNGICDEKYYDNAINYLNNKYRKTIFFVFSDDIKWCKNKWNEDNFIFVDWNKGIESFRDMFLMSKMKHHIIANSTFSWWGATLSEKNGIKIAPKKWNNNFENKLLLDDSWIKI